MKEITDLTNHAAQQSDRWLFIAVLIVSLVAMFTLWRWIVADRDKLATRLTNITDRHIEMTERVAQVVANNTQAINALLDDQQKKQFLKNQQHYP